MEKSVRNLQCGKREPMSWQEEDMIAEQTPSKEKVYSGMQKNVSAAAMRVGRTKPVYVNYTKEGRLRNEGTNVQAD